MYICHCRKGSGAVVQTTRHIGKGCKESRGKTLLSSFLPMSNQQLLFKQLLQIIMEKYCISLDWLQVCGYSQELALLNNPPTSVGIYELQVSEQGTRTFQRLIKVCQSYGGDLVELASVQCLPRSSALRQELCIVKMANRVLYSQTALPQKKR